MRYTMHTLSTRTDFENTIKFCAAAQVDGARKQKKQCPCDKNLLY